MEVAMAYVSELLGREVRDTKGSLVGKLVDLLIHLNNGEQHPRVVALAVVRAGASEPALLPWEGTEDLAGNYIILQRPSQVPYTPIGTELYLSRDVLDKQVIDTGGRRIVRVNDLELAKIGTDYRLVNVDIGGRGLLRRLGLEWIVEHLMERFGREVPGQLVAWRDLDFLPRGDVRVKVPREKLRELHPADIAEILENLTPRLAGALITTMPNAKVADTLEELEPEFQAEVLDTLPKERAADVLEEMEPDEAADLLQELPEEKRTELLNAMEKDEKAEVQELLVHPEDTAGGLMTTAYFSVPPGLTTAQALQHLREATAAKEAETIYYVYILDPAEYLVGVVSLSDLVLASPDTPVDHIMHHKPIRVPLDAKHSEVLEVIAKYNLLAVPVVDDQNRMQGIVTADDALDLILPDEWKIKLPRLF